MNQPGEKATDKPDTIVLSAKSSRFAASLFNYGNIIAVLLPPVGMLWLAMSMVVYALNRHHPNEKVGEYTQQAAYRIYGVTGLIVAAAIFIPKDSVNYYLAIWAVSVLIIVPWSIVDLWRIRKDDWQELEIEKTTQEINND
ncbi:MAG: hypothetical protein GXP13_06275 [Gammaproteobacteria bacterium]|nr:hypothetical protein [Gammaproteobacteria bacterium]